ncbi:YdeI family protein [Actinomadura sp. 6N118]|uniref:YdeI family protein n=1 Tax=Actinomadura sp. 6N118 TaxID=3375151 RepID=UPI003796CE15
MMHFENEAQWESWLAEHHADDGGVWLKIAKKGGRATSLTITQALDVALCYGWIDSQRKAHDEDFYLQRYSPRRKGSPWSRVNVEKVEALIAAGRMRPPGLAEVAAAQADGRWESAYVAQRNATVPPDLAAALEADPQAAARFEALDKTGRYQLILPLLKARTPAGRAARLEKAVSALLSG